MEAEKFWISGVDMPHQMIAQMPAEIHSNNPIEKLSDKYELITPPSNE